MWKELIAVLPSGAAWAARLMMLNLLVLLVTVVPAAANSAGTAWSPPRTVYIAETGQTIDGLFLDLWRDGGGAAAFGHPITPELSTADSRIVQYYEFARFEYWPDGDPAGNLVVLGNLGREMGSPLLRRFAAPGGSGAATGLTEILAWRPVSAAASIDLAAAEPTYRYIAESQHGVWGGFRSFWEQTGGAAYLGNPITEEYITDGVSYQIFERGQLRWEPDAAVSMVPLGTLLAKRYSLDTTPRPQGDLPTYDEALFIPPQRVPAWEAAPEAPAWGRAVVVSLTQQALWAYEDGQVVRSTFVSTGTERTPTPAGYFTVINKIPMQDMEGTINGESYFVADVPNVMYFDNEGNALHGTYWHSNFGSPMSHGCVNLPLDVAEWMYDWAPMGMAVQVLP